MAVTPLALPPQLSLALHHQYDGAPLVADLSGHGNDGRVVAAVTTDGNRAAERRGSGLRFDGRSTRVVVPPSPSLRSLGAVRVDVSVLVDAAEHRRTLVEGFLAMALFVEPDGALAGTVYTGHHWFGAYSGPAAVPIGRPVEVSFLYDGLMTAVLLIDGRTIVRVERPVGPVRSVDWPFGLNVGGWPDGDRRMFSGEMYGLQIWRAAE